MRVTHITGKMRIVRKCFKRSVTRVTIQKGLILWPLNGHYRRYLMAADTVTWCYLMFFRLKMTGSK